MKKLLLTAALTTAFAFANAQTMTSKNGTPILPETDDWSIGFDATPVLNYFGNMFNNTSNNSLWMNYPSNNAMTIVGKMVKDEATAYRAKVAINFNSVTLDTAANVFNNHTDSISIASEKKISNMIITLGAGIQKWRGKGRLKGYYGAEAMVGFGNDPTTKYTYLKPLVATDINVTQVTENKGGSIFGFGVDGFIGVEYFFAPKMSLSAEYTWGIAISSVGESKATTSQVETVNNIDVVTSKTSEGSSSSQFNVGVGNTVTPNVNSSTSSNGSIVLSFYF